MKRTPAFLAWILTILWGVAVVCVVHAKSADNSPIIVALADALPDGQGEDGSSSDETDAHCAFDKFEELFCPDLASLLSDPSLVSEPDSDERTAGLLPGNVLRHEEPPRAFLFFV